MSKISFFFRSSYRAQLFLRVLYVCVHVYARLDNNYVIRIILARCRFTEFSDRFAIKYNVGYFYELTSVIN